MGVAHAQPATHAGAQAVPPALNQDLDARRNVSGCPVGETCTQGADAMREIDLELFPAPGASPWLD